MKHFVYFNLHKKVFSVKNCKSGLVVKHSDTVILTDCEFKVSQAGRNRVLKEKRKNVHAGVKGVVVAFDLADGRNECFVEVTYNPYLYDSFVIKDTKEPVISAKYVIMHEKRVYAIGVEKKLDINLAV